MEENNNIGQQAELQEAAAADKAPEPKPKKDKAPLVLGIIGATAGLLALILVIVGGISNMIFRHNLKANLVNRTQQVIEQRVDRGQQLRQAPGAANGTTTTTPAK